MVDQIKFKGKVKKKKKKFKNVFQEVNVSENYGCKEDWIQEIYEVKSGLENLRYFIF